MTLNACHVAVLEGPGIIRRWLELVEVCLGQHRKSQRILMHGTWSMLSAAKAINFFFSIPPPAQNIEFKTESKNIIDNDDEFIPVHGQSAFSQWNWDGWFYQVYVRRGPALLRRPDQACDGRRLGTIVTVCFVCVAA